MDHQNQVWHNYVKSLLTGIFSEACLTRISPEPAIFQIASQNVKLVKTQGSASPVFPQLGLEPNHAGLASQSLFLLEELLQSKTQWHSKNILKLLELFKKSSELSQTFSKVLQIKRLQLKLKITYQSHLKITCS